MRVEFPGWPLWNYTFPQKDIRDVLSVSYVDAADDKTKTLSEDNWRLATGRNGVCSLVLLDKHTLPKTASRPNAVIVEYEV